VLQLSTTPWRRVGEWRYSSTHSLTSALDGGEWSASRPDRFTPRERASGTHWIGGWAGPRAVLDAVVKRKIPTTRRKPKPRTPIVQPVAQRFTDWAITAVFFFCCCYHHHHHLVIDWVLKLLDTLSMGKDHWDIAKVAVLWAMNVTHDVPNVRGC
jgi:hypothetical protein